jgi:hypothetical protein
MVNVKRPKKMEIVYEYIEPKTPEEAEEAHRRLSYAYRIVVEEVIRRRKAAGYIGSVGQVPPGFKKDLP